MKRRRIINAVSMALLLALLAFAACQDRGGSRGAVPRMTKDALKARLTDPELTVLDVRTPDGWKSSRAKIKGAVREHPEQLDDWTGKYNKEETLVLYCS